MKNRLTGHYYLSYTLLLDSSTSTWYKLVVEPWGWSDLLFWCISPLVILSVIHRYLYLSVVHYCSFVMSLYIMDRCVEE
jgi:hypothetical protein